MQKILNTNTIKIILENRDKQDELNKGKFFVDKTHTHTMNILHILLNILHWISLFFYGNTHKNKKHQITEDITPKDPEAEYYTQSLERFLDTYRKYTPHEMNANIDPVFYDETQHKTAVEQADNELELSWRRRQINVTTPRGNVIMCYDAFKMGFAYYSDQFMPYKLLNAVAMKYVIMYRCRDFFMDENVLPDNHKSALIHAPEEATKTTSTTNFTIPDDAPFAKLKSTSAPKKESDLKSNQPQKQTNKFIHAGPVRNYSPLQKPKKVNPLNGFKSNAIPPQIMTYKQYKQQGLKIL